MGRAPLLVPAIVVGIALTIAHPRGEALDREAATSRYSALVVGDVRAEDDGETGTLLAIAGVGTVRAVFASPVQVAERLTVRGRLEPFDEPRNPGEPSMRAIEADEGVVGRLASARIVEHNGLDLRNPAAWAARLRATASQRIRAVIPEPSATILAGALWGERGTLPDDLHDAFQATGTVHVLVTAGLHLGIIAALLTLVLGQLGLPRAAVCALTFALIVGYAWLTGAHLPAQRATAMLGIALLARACGARVTSWNALAFAAIVIGVLWPASFASASFAMSFSCVAAILLFAEPIATRLHALPLPERVREALALTCATQIGTWPLTAALFSSLAPYAVLANAIVVPLVAVALPLGIATLALPPIAPLTTLVLLAIEATVRTIAALPGARASIGTPSVLSIVVYDALCIATACALRWEHVRVATITFALGCAVVLLPLRFHAPHGLEIVSLDVGQADAAVIRTPNDHIILIDTGGELEHGSGTISNAERAGARIVLGYLRRMGYTHVDLMILTHPHGDHVGGCRPIIDAMPVRMVFDSGQQYGGRAYQDCIASAKAHSVPIVIARHGMRWESGDGVVLDVLAPSMPFLTDTGDDVNENSIVTMLHNGRFRELFMGDAGEASEERLLSAGDDLHAGIVKVGHHGSAYASTSLFASHVRPEYAVISVGRHNTFGHPASTTIEKWKRYTAQVLRTDECGAIMIDPDKLPHTMISCDVPNNTNRASNRLSR